MSTIKPTRSSALNKRPQLNWLSLAITSILMAGGAANSVADETADLVQTIDLSSFPSPDPSGIAFLEDAGTLLICDGEIEEEEDLYTLAGASNLFEMPLVGGSYSGSTVVRSALYGFSKPPKGFSNEPTGLSNVNPATGHIFFADDDAHKVFEVDPGVDGQFGTDDDTVVAVLDTNTFVPFSDDPEGVVLAPGIGASGALFIVEGISHGIYRVDLLNNGLAGSTVTDHFDTQTLGLEDPEGIEYHADTGHLLVIGKPKTKIFEMTIDGTVIQEIDVSAAALVKPAGLALAPDSTGASQTNIYIADRGKDNNINDGDPLLDAPNDGKVFELSFIGGTPTNNSPTASAGANQSIVLPANAALSGSVNDDGLPAGSTASAKWTMKSGPVAGEVTFADNGNSASTTASFTVAGTYVLELEADDGDISHVDEMTVVVEPIGTSTILDIRVAVDNDDAEEKDDGIIELISRLDISSRLVGLRFSSLAIPAGSRIVNAYVQFKAHADSNVDSGFFTEIKGQAIDNALTFDAADSHNISNRATTDALIEWGVAPAEWVAEDQWVAGDEEAAQQTPNIKTIIQEIVGRPGWAEDNSLALIITDTGSGSRKAKSFDIEPAGAPLLHIEFVAGGSGNLPPTSDAGENQTITLSDAGSATVTLDGTVSDDGIPDALTTEWTKKSGLGAVTFAVSNDVDTTATFSVAGTYVLKLTANDGQFSISDELTVIVEAAKISQVITGFTATPATGIVGGTATLSVTGKGASDNAVVFASSTPVICTVNGSTLNMLAAGACTVTANQLGDDEYNPAAEKNLNVTIGKKAQVITGFTSSPNSGTLGDIATLDVGGTGPSGNAASFASSTPNFCTVSGSTLNMIGAGTCTVTANQLGNSDYNAADTVSINVEISKGNQAISGFATTKEGPVIVDEQATLSFASRGASGERVFYISKSLGVCTISESIVSFIGAGTCQLFANQHGDDNYLPAPETAAINITVNKAGQVLGLFKSNPVSTTVGNSTGLNVSAKGASSSPVIYESITMEICTVSDATVTFITAGICKLTANQGGDDNYTAAAPLTLNLNVNKGKQKILGFLIDPTPERVGDTANLTVTGEGTSGNPVEFGGTLGVCSVEGNLLTIVGKGSCTVTADQAGNSNYGAAITVSEMINIDKSAEFLGDSTGDTFVDILDIVETINRVLAGQGLINGADCNEDTELDIQDIVCTINFVLASEQ